MCTPEYSLNDIYRRMMTIIGEYLQVMGFLDLKLEGVQFDRVNRSYFFLSLVIFITHIFKRHIHMNMYYMFLIF